MTLKYRHIASLLDTSRKSWSKYLSYGGLGIGILLLLCSLQLYINIQKTITRDNPRKGGYDFISITKRITNETMGLRDKNLFDSAEIGEIKKQPFVEDAAPLIANKFHVVASAGNIVEFSTDLFVEALDNEFLDTVPPNFTWKEGQPTLPLILSADFLEIYNVLAPGKDYPQISDETIGALQIVISCYGPTGWQDYRASVVALTNRVNSVLVPKEFLNWANRRYAGSDAVKSSRVFLKMKDANNPDFIHFLDQKNYRVNEDKIKFGRLKSQLQMVVSGLGVIGLLVVVLALMLFSFYLQLIIAKSKDNLQLLLMLGYEPGWLSRVVSQRWIPVYTTIVIVALAIASLVQYIFYLNMHQAESSISPLLHWSVWALSAVLIFLTVYSNFKIIRKQLYKLS